jgi:hypothetical protein
MGKMKYQASFSYADANPASGKVSNGATVPLMGFHVVRSGVQRLINLDSTDDMDIASYMEEAKKYKLVYIYLPSTRGIEIAELFNYATTPNAPLKITLMVTAFSGGVQTKSLSLVSNTASIGPHITPVGDRTSVQVTLDIGDAKLRYTSYVVKRPDRRTTIIHSHSRDL